MRRLSPLLLLVVAVAAGCGTAVTAPDLALIPLGCRAPNKCFVSVCGCNRADVETGGACLVCDPAASSTGAQQCDCNADGGYTVDTDLGTLSGQMCIEPLQLCVGRGVLCAGAGARCFDPRQLNGTCPSTGGDPPALVAVGDGGVASEPHCNYADDVCCPGAELDMSVPDLSQPPDLLGATATD
jgi:hypothetical protein